MEYGSGRLTVYFEGPFWVGIFERIEAGELSACKVTFGAEPKDYEVYDFVLAQYLKLEFSPGIASEDRAHADNPKRRQRAARKQMIHSGAGTKSQQALRLQREQRKTERRQTCRTQKEAEERRRFDLKQAKRKEKHRGH